MAATNQRQSMYQFKQSLLGFAGVWSVALSSTPTMLGATGVDLWTSPSAITRPGTSLGPYSWILLQRTDGVQLVIGCTTDAGYVGFTLSVSPGGLFTGGTAGTPPTATDVLIANPGTDGIYGTNSGNDTQYTQHFWQSTDGTITRWVVFAGATAANPICEFGIARALTPDPSINPIVMEYQQDSAHNQASPNTILSIHPPAAWFGVDFMQLRATPSLISAATAVALGMINTYAAANTPSGKWPLYNSYIQGDTGGGQGLLGKMRDVWWWAGPDGHAFTNCGVYTSGSSALFVINSVVLPWTVGVAPLGITPATVGPFLGFV